MLCQPKANKSCSHQSNFLENCFFYLVLWKLFQKFCFCIHFFLYFASKFGIVFSIWCDLTLGRWWHRGKLTAVVWHYNNRKSTLCWKRNDSRKTDILLDHQALFHRVYQIKLHLILTSYHGALRMNSPKTFLGLRMLGKEFNFKGAVLLHIYFSFPPWTSLQQFSSLLVMRIPVNNFWQHQFHQIHPVARHIQSWSLIVIWHVFMRLTWFKAARPIYSGNGFTIEFSYFWYVVHWHENKQMCKIKTIYRLVFLLIYYQVKLLLNPAASKKTPKIKYIRNKVCM